MESHFAACVALLREQRHDGTGEVCGAGFLIDRRHVMTCAHVVNRALELDPGNEACPTGLVQVELPFAGGEPIQARVVEWHQMISYSHRDTRQLSDIAVLRLETEAPAGATVARLIRGGRNGGQSVRCFGFPTRAGHAGQIAEAMTIAEDATGWVHLRQVPGGGPVITEGYSGAPIFEVGSFGVIGMIVAFDAARDPHQAQLAYGKASWRLQLAWPALARPYKGLGRFESSDAEYFFGRESTVEELRRRIMRENLVMVVGPSGGGKSSLVYGGLLPSLDEPGGDTMWRVAPLRPGIDPLASLAGAVARALGDTGAPAQTLDLAEILLRRLARGGGARMLARLIEAVRHRGPAARLLLVVDAFEELFTLCCDSAIRASFIDLIAAIGRQAGQGIVTLLGTLRADFTGELMSDEVLAAALDGHYMMLRAMNGAELGRAIRLPAKRLGVLFEAGVDDDLLATMARDPAALPLMEYALEWLWAEQREHLLTRSAYTRMGGMAGALALHADATWEKMDEVEQARARRLLCRLVTVAPPGAGEDRKRSQTRAELGGELWQVARTLAGQTVGYEQPARLVILSRDDCGRERADIAHRGLPHCWPRLRGWLDEERPFLVLLAEWQRALQRWESDERPDRLLRGADLDEALAHQARVASEYPELLRFLAESGQAAVEQRGLIASDAIWDRLEFQGGQASPGEWAALAELATADEWVRRAFLRRMFEVPDRARRFCRLPGPVVRAAVGLRRSGAAALRALIGAQFAPRPGAVQVLDPAVLAASLFGLAMIEADETAEDELGLGAPGQLAGPVVAAFTTWLMALAPLLGLERADHLLGRLLDLFAPEHATQIAPADLDRLARAGSALAGRLSHTAAAMALDRTIDWIRSSLPEADQGGFQALGRIAESLAGQLDEAVAGDWLVLILGAIETSRETAQLRALVPAARELTGRLPAAEVAPLFDRLADAIDRAVLPGRLRALAQIAFALARQGVPLDRARAENMLRRLWERGRDHGPGTQLEALSQAGLALAAGLDGVWAARVLDRVLEAIDQTVDADHLGGLGNAARLLAAALEPDQAGRALDYVVDLLDWTTHPGRQAALGTAAEGLVVSLAPARVTQALDQVLNTMARSDNPLELQLMGRLGAALAAKLEAVPAAAALELLLVVLEAPGSPARSRALGVAALGLAQRLDGSAAMLAADRIIGALNRVADFDRVAALAMGLAGLAAALDAGRAASALATLLAAVDLIPLSDLAHQTSIEAMAGAASALALALPTASAAALFNQLLARFGRDGDEVTAGGARFRAQARLVRDFAESRVAVDPALARGAMLLVLAALADGDGGEARDLARTAAALASLPAPSSPAGALWEALKLPRTALDGADRQLIDALRQAVPDLPHGRHTGYWASIEWLDSNGSFG